MLASGSMRRLALVQSCLVLLIAAGAALPAQMAAAQGRVENLQQGQTHSLSLRFTGEQPHPLTMVSGDFDEDGVQDLIVGYRLDKGGSIALLSGRLDATVPQTRASWLAAGKHQYAAPFYQRLKPLSIKTQPSLMVSADVNGDGHLDLVYAARGSNVLYVLLGTGQGTFSQKAVSLALPGGVTALAAYRPAPRFQARPWLWATSRWEVRGLEL